ncbi:MAG: hypothetical protein AABW48_01330 [Nanoarchaeota archaeon]
MLDDFVIKEILRKEREKKKQWEPIPLQLPIDEPQLPLPSTEKDNPGYEPVIIPLGEDQPELGTIIINYS